MSKPQAFVNRNGLATTLATGISIHKPSVRFYIRDAKGNRRYFRTWDAAKAHLDRQAISREPDVVLEVADDPFFDGPPRDELPPDGTPLDEVPLDHPHRGWLEVEEAGRGHARLRRVAADEFWALAKCKYQEDPRLFCERVGIDLDKPDLPAPAHRITMRDIGKRWKEYAEQRHGGATRHTTETMRRWTEFVRKVGNPAISELTPETFRQYHSHLEIAGRGKSAKWFGDRAATAHSVLCWAARKYPEWNVSPAALVWADSYDRRRYKPKVDNRRPIAPDEFAELIAACKQWQAIDVDSMPSATQSERGRKSQAATKQRAGWMLDAILKLAVNAALDNVDIERLEWANLKLDADWPHMDFARRKVEHLVGQPISRITPLLPATVAALREWKKRSGRTSGLVFCSAAGGRLNRAMLARLFKQAKVAAGINATLSFKHLRNAAPTLAHKKFKSRDLADLILGHHLPSTAKYYVGDRDSPEPLVELVQAAAVAYGGA